MTYHKTASELIAEVRWIADVQANTVRHTDGDLLYALNAAYSAAVKLLTKFGYENFCSFGTVATTANQEYAALDTLLSTEVSGGTTKLTYSGGWDEIVSVTLVDSGIKHQLH